MCTLCQITQTFDPLRHGDNPSRAELSENGPDAFAFTTTQYTMSVGDNFSGTIGANGDEDWVRIDLVSGETYQFDLRSVDSRVGTLDDPYLALYDSSGTFIEGDDDGGVGFEAQLVYTATYTGTYYLSASSFDPVDNGTYVLGAGTSTGGGSTGDEGSLDELADYLREGYWQDQGRGERRFDTRFDNVITVDIDALTADGKQLARWAFEAWEMVIDVDFQEVSFGADIFFDDNDSGAYANSSGIFGGYIGSSEINVSQSEWVSFYGDTIDSYSFATYIHEVGHAIGLGHQGDYNGNATYGIDDTFSNDSWQVSVMSYFSQNENTSTNATDADVISAMMADIVAAQTLYGAAGAGSVTDGDTTWGANSNIGGYLGTYFDNLAANTTSSTYSGGRVAFTVFDVGGIDTVDLNFLNTNNRVDLRAETFSDVGGLIGNVAIARNTVIENFIGGSGNDEVTGNDADNEISGRLGNDTLSGSNGNDTITAGSGDDEVSGGSGMDSIRGGDGTDLLRGGRGQDSIFGDAGNDIIRSQRDADRVQAGAGDDNVKGGGGNDTLFGEDGNDFLKGGTRQDDLFGGWGNDRLIGNAFDDSLNGGGGDDTLNAGGDNDTLIGGTGQDVMKGGSGEDTFVFSANYDADTITDFNMSEDILQLSVALTGTRNVQAVVDRADVQDIGVVLDFDSTVITLEGLNSTVGLDEAILIV